MTLDRPFSFFFGVAVTSWSIRSYFDSLPNTEARMVSIILFVLGISLATLSFKRGK